MEILHRIVVTSIRPKVEVHLVDQDGYVDLSSATNVKFFAYLDGKKIIDEAAATIENATTGKVSYQPTATSFITPGLVSAQFMVNWAASDDTEVFPLFGILVEPYGST